MGAAIAESGSHFSDKILQFLERVQHRVATTPDEKEAAYRLRYDAYIRNELIDPREDGLLHDSYDDAPNSWIVSTHIDGEMVATVRVSVAVGADGALPSQGVFSDVISPRLRAGHKVADFTRAAARLEASKRFPELPYLALRPGFMALAHFDADFAIATPRADHAAFYRRVFRFTPWSEERAYPNVAPKIMCLGMEYHAVRDGVEARYPFFRSTQDEREALFGRHAATELAQRATIGRRPNLEVRASA